MSEPATPTITAIVFDLGGVIIRTDHRAPRTALAARYGMTYEQLDALVWSTPSWKAAETGQIPLNQAWAEIGRSLNLNAQQLADFQREFFGGDRIDIVLVDMIRRLRRRYRTGLLSNNWITDLGAWLEREYGLSDLFDDIVSSAQVGLAKPGPEIYQLALRRLSARPEQVVFVDDAPWNIDGALAVGMHAIRFQSTAQLAQELQALLGHPV